MPDETLEVVAIDWASGPMFLLYFSDDTFANVSARDLAVLFPHRSKLPDPDYD